MASAGRMYRSMRVESRLWRVWAAIAVQGDAGDSGAGGVSGAQRVGGDRPVAVHQPTIDYAARRTAEGLFKRDIIRCLKRYLAREIYQAVMADHRAREGTATEGAPTKS